MKAIFLFLFALLILRCFPSATSNLTDSCKKASQSSDVDYDFCLTSFQVNSQSNIAPTEGLALIAGNLTKVNYTSTKAEIDSIIGSIIGSIISPNGMAVIEAYGVCSDVFRHEIKDIDTAVRNIKSSNITGALAVIGEVKTAPEKCEKAFVSRGLPVPDDDDLGNARKLSSIFQAFTEFLQQ